MVTTVEPASQTLAFLFTDIEGSTRLWEQYRERMKDALECHDAILREAVEASNGRVVKSTGDGFMVVFASATDGLSACLKAQHDLASASWGETGALRVRMALHVGEAARRNGDYYGPTLNRAARVMSAGHGGQVLLSAAAAALVGDPARNRHVPGSEDPAGLLAAAPLRSGRSVLAIREAGRGTRLDRRSARGRLERHRT